MKKKQSNYRSNQFALNRTQIHKLAELAKHFENVEWFTLEEDNSSGIGPTVTVRFDIFNDSDKDNDASVNITDVSTW